MTGEGCRHYGEEIIMASRSIEGDERDGFDATGGDGNCCA